MVVIIKIISIIAITEFGNASLELVQHNVQIVGQEGYKRKIPIMDRYLSWLAQ